MRWRRHARLRICGGVGESPFVSRHRVEQISRDGIGAGDAGAATRAHGVEVPKTTSVYWLLNQAVQAGIPQRIR